MTNTEKARKAYRDAIARQAALPVDQQWTMGAEIKALKAAAYVEAECKRFGWDRLSVL